MRSKQKMIYYLYDLYFLYNYSIHFWGRIDPEAQKCKRVGNEDHLKVKCNLDG